MPEPKTDIADSVSAANDDNGKADKVSYRVGKTKSVAESVTDPRCGLVPAGRK
jgi:hypothetical protein